MSWYIKSRTSRIPYLGQCDELRCSFPGDTNWQRMIELRRPVPVSELMEVCDVSALLDDDDSLLDWGRDDSGSGSYRSYWGDVPCYFFQTAGFEFIWADIR